MIDTTHYKQRLEAELAVVTSELQSLGIQSREDGHDWITTPAIDPTEADENVTADASEEYANRDGILADLETRYNEITDALQKIEAGTYGICEVSGEPIEAARLDANPAARTCTLHREQAL
jgi:RNA polymerase-binding transcription factor DksA